MNMMKRKMTAKGTLGAIAAILGLAACQLPGSGSGEPYTPRGNPWETAASHDNGGGETAKADPKGGAKPDPAPDAKGDAKGSKPATTASDPSMTSGTVLEQLDAAKLRVAKLDEENEKIKADNASLTLVVETLKGENKKLSETSAQAADGRARIDQEMEQLRQQVKDAEARARQLADEVLQERIQRVRVERELILAKVQEAENADGGN